METISCVMCTYNGEKYILPQLQSIAEQTKKISELVIFDDISFDDTINIIKKWAKENSHINVKININEQRLGPATNFAKALEASSGDYIFFCDQDDVWKKNKVEICLEKMKEVEGEYGRNLPCLVHTDLEVVDQDLKIIATSFLSNQGLYHVEDSSKQLSTLLAQNFVTGCTMLINRALKNTALPFPQNIIMHDYWLALVAAASGKLVFVNKSTIKYRQHGHNTVGAKKYISFDNFKKIFKCSELISRIDKTVLQDEELAGYKQGMLLQKNPVISKFLNIIHSGSFFQALFSSTHKQGFLRDVCYHIFLAIYVKERQRQNG
nr:glycosyltransferase family 2 protein [Mitsuokella multacida]